MYKDWWRWGSNYFEFPKIQEKENLIEPIHNLAASMYYTYSKIQFEMGVINFIMSLRTKNTKHTINKKPVSVVFSTHKDILKQFTEYLNKVYPSKRPVHCIMRITYPACGITGGKPYFPTNFIGYRLPMLNGIESFKTDECIICTETPPNIVYCICGHICICEECNKKHKSSVCLICKTHNVIRKI